MVFELLTEAVLGAIADRAVSAVLSLRGANRHVRIEADSTAYSLALRDHLRFVETWSSEISFRDLLRSKKLANSFVDLECHVGQIAAGDLAFGEQPRPVTSLLDYRHHIVILGRPGAGKTTSLQKLALTSLERYGAEKAHIPLLVRLRELSVNESLLGRLAAITGVRVFHERKKAVDPSGGEQEAEAEEERINPEGLRELQRRALSSYLDSTQAVLFLDGLDECPRGSRRQVERDINDLMQHAIDYTIVLTCRSADYGFSFPAQVYTILPLSVVQVRKFAVRWLGVRQADKFVTQLDASPYRGAEVHPLTIAHLCAIYERRGAIPAQPRSVYQKIVRLLLEEWDEQRGIQRKSRYADFDIDRKQEFLRRIAYELTISGSRGAFSHFQLEKAYLRSHAAFGLPRAEYSRVAREIESHTGLILQSAHDQYEFAHKSIQEYLTAEYLLRLPGVSERHVLDLGEELAVATALSSAAELYVESIAETLLSSSDVFAKAYFARVYLGRLVVERPDLEPDEWLGWTLLALWNLSGGATKANERGRTHEQHTAALRALTTHEKIRQSLALAFVRAQDMGHHKECYAIAPGEDVRLSQRVGTYIRFQLQQILVEGSLVDEVRHEVPPDIRLI